MIEEYKSLEEIDSEEKKLAKLAEKDYTEFIDNVTIAMRENSTRVLVRAILEHCGFYNAVVPEGEKALHAEGRRFVGMQLKAILDEVDPELFFELQLEGVKDAKVKNLR